jgi:anti-sigma regulatory factor (Ser/Thr protein kinase)
MNTASTQAMRPSACVEAAADCVVTATIWPLDPALMVRHARRLLREHLAGRLDMAVMEDVEVMVSEVATNAGLHCQGPYELRVVEHDGIPVAVEFADTGPGLDLVAERLAASAITVDLDEIDEASLGLGGRGLSIVARLSSGRCGVRPTRLKGCPAPGKSVWFAIPRSLTHRPQGLPA